MALMQLVSCNDDVLFKGNTFEEENKIEENACIMPALLNLENLNTIREYNKLNLSIEFNKSCSVVIPKLGDNLIGLYLTLTMKELPDGLRYKRNWILHAIKNVSLSMNNKEVFNATKEWLNMQNLIFNTNVNNNKLLFNYDDATRTELSKNEHTIVFEPFNLKDLICSYYGITLLNMRSCDIEIKIDFGSFNDCIEQYKDISLQKETSFNHYIITSYLNCYYQYLDTSERRMIAANTSNTIIKQFKNNSVTVTNKNKKFKVEGSSLCSAAYIHITDLQGNEIPKQVIKYIKIYLNGVVLQKINGYNSKYLINKDLPHDTKSNDISENLYYISYFNGKKTKIGVEHGLNFSRIDTICLEFTYENWMPYDMQFKLNISHRINNMLIHGDSENNNVGLYNNDNFTVIPYAICRDLDD